MVLVSIPASSWFGVMGLLWTWLLSELTQMLLIYQENRKLFSGNISVNLGSFLRMAALLAVLLPCCIGAMRITLNWPIWKSILALLLEVGVLTCVSYCVFDVKVVWKLLREQLQRRVQTEIASA